MSKRDFRLLLEDIVEAIDKIKTYTENLTFEEFNRDGKTSDAVVRNLEIIGEATSRIPKHIREKYTDIEWHKIISVRNRIIHDYFGIDYEIVWEILTTHLADLKTKILLILNENPTDEN